MGQILSVQDRDQVYSRQRKWGKEKTKPEWEGKDGVWQPRRSNEGAKSNGILTSLTPR